MYQSLTSFNNNNKHIFSAGNYNLPVHYPRNIEVLLIEQPNQSLYSSIKKKLFEDKACFEPTHTLPSMLCVFHKKNKIVCKKNHHSVFYTYFHAKYSQNCLV